MTGYQSLMLLQSLKLDGFNTREVSMDIVKNNECIGYTTFRNALVEKRISLLDIKELEKEITSLEKNETTGRIDHPTQTRKVLEDGTIVKSVGKDISDSLGGAVYNATLSVDMNEVERLDVVTLTNNLNPNILGHDSNVAMQYFNFGQDLQSENNIIDTSTYDNELKTIDNQINKQLNEDQKLINKIRKDNPTTQLTDAQILNLYSNMGSDGMIIF